MANHYVLQPSQPDSVALDSYVNRQYVDPGDDTTVDPHELINPAGGEDIDVEDLAGGDDDYVEPSETQKKEIFKIHRGLGHPLPNEFGRALNHAGMRRSCIRWAVKEMRCPVCEARVAPATRRPGALPRCLRFNQTVGVDLVEFDTSVFKKIHMNVV